MIVERSSLFPEKPLMMKFFLFTEADNTIKASNGARGNTTAGNPGEDDGNTETDTNTGVTVTQSTTIKASNGARGDTTAGSPTEDEPPQQDNVAGEDDIVDDTDEDTTADAPNDDGGGAPETTQSDTSTDDSDDTSEDMTADAPTDDGGEQEAQPQDDSGGEDDTGEDTTADAPTEDDGDEQGNQDDQDNGESPDDGGDNEDGESDEDATNGVLEDEPTDPKDTETEVSSQSRKYNLYRDFMHLYNSNKSYIEKLEGIRPDGLEANIIINSVLGKLNKIDSSLFEYMTIRFSEASYVESLVFFQQVIAVIRLCFALLNNNKPFLNHTVSIEDLK